jgi:hypothetical protein
MASPFYGRGGFGGVAAGFGGQSFHRLYRDRESDSILINPTTNRIPAETRAASDEGVSQRDECFVSRDQCPTSIKPSQRCVVPHSPPVTNLAIIGPP